MQGLVSHDEPYQSDLIASTLKESKSKVSRCTCPEMDALNSICVSLRIILPNFQPHCRSTISNHSDASSNPLDTDLLLHCFAYLVLTYPTLLDLTLTLSTGPLLPLASHSSNSLQTISINLPSKSEIDLGCQHERECEQ